MSKLKLNEKGQKDVQLMQTAEQIISKMTVNSELFPSPVPSLSVVQNVLTAFRNSVTEAAHRDMRAIMIRNQRKKELLYVLKELGKYVDSIANGDGIIILAAGYSLHKQPVSYRGLVPKAQRPIAKPGEIGSRRIMLRADPWPGARMYNFQYRQKGTAAEWKSQLSSKSSCIIEGLEMFKLYEFRTSYVGIDPTPNFSDSTISYVV